MITLALFTLLADSPPPPPIRTIELSGMAIKQLIISDAKGEVDSETNVTLEGNRVTVTLALGDEPDKVIKFHPARSDVQLRVEQQFETSATIMGEGPHIDLRDWKHHTTSFETLDFVEPNTVQVKKHTELDTFPKVTTEELVEAVRAHRVKEPGAAEYWIKLAKTCKTVNTYPCGVGVSTIRLRVQTRSKNQKWKTALFVDIQNPMGC